MRKSSSDQVSGSRPGPHEFKSRRDPGLAAFAAGSAGSTGGSAGVPPSVVTGNFLRQATCAVPGCGRSELDPMHEAPED